MPDDPPEKTEDEIKTENSSVVGQLQHVTIKAPEFMETAVIAWFQIMESQFLLKGVKSDETRFHHVISVLPASIVAKITPELLTATSYIKIKEAVISIYEQTKPELFEKLISSTTMSGRPSVYLQEMLSVASKINVSEDLIKHKFIKSLPPSISAVVATQKELSLTQLGKLADELLPYFGASKPVFSINEASATYRNRSPSPQPRQTSFPTKTVMPFASDQRPKICRGHIYYAERSKTCTRWCRWPDKTSCKIQNSRPNSRNSSPNRSRRNSTSSENYVSEQSRIQ